jgi:hypothetical protein
MTDSSVQIDALADEIRAADAVVIMGAGFSYEAGMPLSGQLAPLVWHALDSHPELRRATCDAMGVLPGGAKDVIGLDWLKMLAAFSSIAADRDARRTFQHSFAGLDEQRSSAHSTAHAALARLIHCGLVRQAVSLNWDTLLEAAFGRQYGIDLNVETIRLWKPHGDCRRPDEEWILPHSPGSIPEELIKRMTALAEERPRILVIAGYSERDEVVVKRLIAPLASHWRVSRIGPAARGEGAICLSAADALHRIAARLNPEPEFPGWEYVSFAEQRGLQAAISGERLGPRDVEACPRLPYLASAKNALDLLHKVEIAGGSGCGKSITAWQLASDYNRDGWEILRPDAASAEPGVSWKSLFEGRLWKRVLVVDDTQKFPNGFADRLAERAGDRIKVILGTTDTEGERSAAIRLPAQTAVRALAEEMRQRRAQILPIVRHYDSHVGDGYLDMPLERRIADAAEASTPWQFAYMLRGGWSQARRALDNLRDFNRADLLLLCIASRQIVSLDAGCKTEEVAADAARLGWDASSLQDGLDLLLKQAAILPGIPIRCPHIQAAMIAIRRFFADRKDSHFTAAVSPLRSLCVEGLPPLRGVSWLLRELCLTDAFRSGDLLSAEDADRLVQRCCGAATALERRDAGFLLSTLLWHRTLMPQALTPYHAVLKNWLETVEGGDAYGLGTMVNDLGNADKHSAQMLMESVDPEKIAAQLAEARTAEGFAWGYFLERLAVAGKEWRARMKAALPGDSGRALAAAFNRLELAHLNSYLKGVAAFDPDLATECLKAAMPSLQAAFADNPVEAFTDINDVRWFILGHHPFGDGKPTKAQRRLSKTITEAIKPERVVAGFCSCRYGDWESYAGLLYWIRQVNSAKHGAIVNSVDWEGLDVRAAELWQRPPREFRLLLHGLVMKNNGDPVRSWIAAHGNKISEIDPITASISPETAVVVVRKGGCLNLAGHNGSDWRLQAVALARIGEVAKDIAVAALDSEQVRIVNHLSTLSVIDCEELPVFLEFVEQFAPGFPARLFAAVDLKTASASWPAALVNTRKEVRQGARLLFKFASRHAGDDIKALADRLSGSRPRRGAQRRRS